MLWMALSLGPGLSACDGTADDADGGQAAGSPNDAGGTGASALDDALALRPLSASADARIVDDLDREVLLRGANVNSLGEYAQGDPAHAPTIPITDADFRQMAARGLSVVRLIVTWSRIEPERGVIDDAYLDEVDATITTAASHGIYTVVDMHQDAYSAFIFTTDATECEAGSEPGKGWDGAPAWACITDGLSTCVTGSRNSAPAVMAAWNHFYDNTDGIRERFVASWAALAERFAGRPEVAGYDVLNEPEVSRPSGELGPIYNQLLADTIVAIRAAEEGADFEHLIIVEPAIPAGDPDLGIVLPDPVAAGAPPGNLVAGPHNYAESIPNSLNLTTESMNTLSLSVAGGLGMPVWTGEYGFWNREPETLEAVRRFAIDEDAYAWGGAWWQWRQGCGDPHSHGWGQSADTDQVHLNIIGCPGDVDLGPNEDFLSVLGRGFPRAAPGRVQELRSDPDTGELSLTASGASADDTVVVWTPTDATTHSVVVEGLSDVVEHTVEGGRVVVATVDDADYVLRVAR